MTPKMIALRNTAIVIGSGIAAGIGIALAFTYLSVAQIGIAFLVVGMLIVAHMVYEQELDKAKRRQELNNLKD